MVITFTAHPSVAINDTYIYMSNLLVGNGFGGFSLIKTFRGQKSKFVFGVYKL